MCKINTTLYNMFSSQVFVNEETKVTSTKFNKCYHEMYWTHNHFSQLEKKAKIEYIHIK